MKNKKAHKCNHDQCKKDIRDLEESALKHFNEFLAAQRKITILEKENQSVIALCQRFEKVVDSYMSLNQRLIDQVKRLMDKCERDLIPSVVEKPVPPAPSRTY